MRESPFMQYRHSNPYQMVARPQVARQPKGLDYRGTVIKQMLEYERCQFEEESPLLKPVPAGTLDMLPAKSYGETPASNFNTKFVHVSTNKIKCPVNALVWTPGGRRL